MSKRLGKLELDGDLTVGGSFTGTATSTNALESATTTVNVSSATAPSSGQVLTATGSTTATWQTPSGGGSGNELDYVAKTSSTSITATTQGTADTIVTGSSVAYDGSTVVMIEFNAPWARPDTASSNRNIKFVVYEDSSALAEIAYIATPQTGTLQVPIFNRIRHTPSNASHTYSVRAYVNAGTGSVSAGTGSSGAAAPAYIRIIEA